MSAPLQEVRDMATAVFDALEKLGTTHVNPSEGWYWSIDSAETWDMTKEPALMTGDLADDIHDIRKDLTEYQDIAAHNAWHTLNHFIGVLTTLSHQFKAREGLAQGEGA